MRLTSVQKIIVASESPDDYAADIERLEYPAVQEWTIIRVSSRQLRYDGPEFCGACARR